MRVAGHEREQVGCRIRVVGPAHDARRELGDERRRRGDVAVVALVPAAQALALQRGDVHAADVVEGRVEQRAGHIAHPAQPREDLRAVGAEAQRLTQPLVQWGERPRAVAGLRDHDRHARCDDPRHRAGGADVLAGEDRDAAAGDDALGLGHVGGLALEHQRAAQGAARRADDVAQRDRRPGVQVAARAELGAHRARGAHPDRADRRGVKRGEATHAPT